MFHFRIILKFSESFFFNFIYAFLLNSDVRVPTNSEITNLLIPSNKEQHDPMVSSFNEHTSAEPMSYNLIAQINQQQQPKLTDNGANSALTIQNFDNSRNNDANI